MKPAAPHLELLPTAGCRTQPLKYKSEYRFYFYRQGDRLILLSPFILLYTNGTI